MIFSETERKIFQYFNGEKEVFADPLDVDRKLRQFMGNPRKITDSIREPGLLLMANPDAAGTPEYTAAMANADNAMPIFLDAVARAFEIPKRFDPATGMGYTERNLRDLWDKFQAWLSEKKNVDENPSTSTPPLVRRELPR